MPTVYAVFIRRDSEKLLQSPFQKNSVSRKRDAVLQFFFGDM